MTKGKKPGGETKTGTPKLRMKATRVKSKSGRSISSTRWLNRQLNDPYVAGARMEGYRSRAAFKLLQLHERFKLLHADMRVVDLGAAPGGWSQVVLSWLEGKGQIVAMDILAMDPLPNVTFLQTDFMAEDSPRRLMEALKGKADLVLSDMAAPTTGHAGTDHLRIMALAEAAYDFAAQVLAPGGSFVCKLFQGGAEKALLNRLKHDFASVRHAKPPASRQESSETYVVAQGFSGKK